jgi:hypothetical protein
MALRANCSKVSKPQEEEKEDETYPVHLVGDVAKHDGGAHIVAVEDGITADTVVLVGRVTIERLSRERVDGQTVSDDATLIIDTRLGAMRRIECALAGPRGRVDSDPLERLLRKS